MKKGGITMDEQNQEIITNGEDLKPEDKTWAMISHLGIFAGMLIPFGHILAPLIVYFVKKDSSSFITYHAKESLNFQISITIYGIVASILTLVLIGVLLLVALFIFMIVVVIQASMKANRGEEYKYPLTIRFIK